MKLPTMKKIKQIKLKIHMIYCLNCQPKETNRNQLEIKK
jgi:hypothetical protein